MPAVTVTYANTQVEGITRNTLLKRLLRDLGLGQYGTATSGSTTTIVDTARLQSTQYNSQQWVGGWARIGKDAGGAGAAPEGEISPITTNAPGTGTITFNPAVSAAVAANDEYQLWYKRPQDVLDLIDRCLTEDLYFPCWTILSEHPDSDMEGATGDWSAGGTASIAKRTTDPVFSGKQVLRVTNSAALDYAGSVNYIEVEPNRSYHVSVVVRIATGTGARLAVQDETNASVIKYADSSSRGYVRIGFDFTTPSTCRRITFKLHGIGASEVTDWDELSFFEIGSSSIALPWWVKNKNQVIGVFEADLRGLGTDLYDAELQGDLTDRFDIVDNAFGRGILRLQTRYGGITRPLFILGLRNETAYANDNIEKKLIDSRLLIACIGYRYWQTMVHLGEASETQRRQAKEQHDKWEKDYYRYQAEFLDRIQTVITSPTPWVSVGSSDSYGFR